jgi:hypothetical protein
MKTLIVLLLALLGLAVPGVRPVAIARPPVQWLPGGIWARIPYIGGTWYMWGDEDQPCFIRQRRGSNQAVFINEHGNRAEGWIRGDRVWIPDWGQNGQGQAGLIRGDRIIWLPDRSYWSRRIAV